MKSLPLFLLAPLLLAACAGGDTEAARWRRAGRVFVLVDTANFYANMQNALATEGYGNVTIKNAPPEYVILDGAVAVYLSESGIPVKTSYAPMSPHQAAEVALNYQGSEGICVNPTEDRCERRLDRKAAADLEAELKKDAGPPESFAMMRKP